MFLKTLGYATGSLLVGIVVDRIFYEIQDRYVSNPVVVGIVQLAFSVALSTYMSGIYPELTQAVHVSLFYSTQINIFNNFERLLK